MEQVKVRNAKVKTLYISGLEGKVAEVEASIFQGLPSFEVVGLGDSSIREAKERVRASIRSCGFLFPNQRLLVNISPAYLPKSGSSFDLAIAMAILLATGQIRSNYEEITIYGELSLTGQVRAVPGSISRLLSLPKEREGLCLVPSSDQKEAALLGVSVLGVDDLIGAVEIVSGYRPYSNKNAPVSFDDSLPEPSVDISCLCGQPAASRALVLSASGFHNLLMVGSPGTGKSLSAQILQGLLPPLSKEEKIDLLRVESALTVLSPETLRSLARPFRYVHHTCTSPAMVGGGRSATPGEVSRALHGILFLDELPEFSPHVLDLLRVPLETGSITISRSYGNHEFPARFLLVSAMNPCRCGKYLESPSECTCTASMISSYQGRISGALLDRMDIYCVLGRITEESLLSTMKDENRKESVIWRERIRDLWEIQYRRCDEAGIPRQRNGECRERGLGEIFRFGKKEMEYAAMVAHQMKMSVRGLHRMIRLARTIADLDGKRDVKEDHITEAMSFRLPKWGESRGENDHA